MKRKTLSLFAVCVYNTTKPCSLYKIPCCRNEGKLLFDKLQDGIVEVQLDDHFFMTNHLYILFLCGQLMGGSVKLLFFPLFFHHCHIIVISDMLLREEFMTRYKEYVFAFWLWKAQHQTSYSRNFAFSVWSKIMARPLSTSVASIRNGKRAIYFFRNVLTIWEDV